MIGTFGPVVFTASERALRTFSGLKRSRAARYAQHDVINGVPKLERNGLEVEEITFSMRFDAAMGVEPMDEINALRAIRDNHQWHTLVIGERQIGEFVMPSMEEDWIAVTGRGRLILATVAVTIREYRVDDI